MNTDKRARLFLNTPYLLSLSLLFLLSSAQPSFADAQQEAKLDALKHSISELQSKLKEKDQKKSNLMAELRQVELKASSIAKTIRKLENKINQLDTQLKQLTVDRRNLERSIQQQRNQIITQIQSAHKLGKQEPLKLLLNQEDPAKLSRMLKYYSYFLQQRTTKIDRYLADIQSLAQIIATINQQKQALNASREDLQQQQNHWAAQKEQRKTTLKKLTASLKSDRDRLKNLEKERSHLAQLIAAVETAIADMALPDNYQPIGQMKGKLEWPLKGRVRHSFGSHRSGELRWEGWLIAASSGSSVKTVHHGRVVFSDYLRGFGLLIIVDHGDDYMSLYAHNEILLKETGDWVSSNETVAQSGNTGGLSEPALYFEIRKKGQPADPKKWLVKRR